MTDSKYKAVVEAPLEAVAPAVGAAGPYLGPSTGGIEAAGGGLSGPVSG